MIATASPLNLWTFARHSYPRTVKCAVMWVDKNKVLSLKDQNRLTAELAKRNPNRQAWELISLQTDDFTAQWSQEQRNRAELYLTIYLPCEMKKKLLGGNYIIKGRRNGEKSFTTLSADDLIGLDIEFSKDRLVGANVVYEEVIVTPIRKGKGRRPGDGKYTDMPHYKEMRQLIESGKAKSPNDAATQVAPHARGTGTERATIERLGKGYRAWEKEGFPG